MLTRLSRTLRRLRQEDYLVQGQFQLHNEKGRELFSKC